MKKALKFSFAVLISFALLCLSNCGDSESSESSNNLEVKCLGHTGNIITKKTLVGVEIIEKEEFAVLTNSNGKTHVHLDEIALDCAAVVPALFKINYDVDVDTLKLTGMYSGQGACGEGCISSIDLTIESIGDSIKYLVYEEEFFGEKRDGTLIFQVKYQ